MFRSRLVPAVFCVLVLFSARSTAADDADAIKPFIGGWKAVNSGMEEGWLISKEPDGKVKIIGQYRDAKNFRILGGFVGENVEVKDGKIHATRVFVRKPNNNNLHDNLKVVIEIDGGKLRYSWNIPGHKGSRSLDAIR